MMVAISGTMRAKPIKIPITVQKCAIQERAAKSEAYLDGEGTAIE